MNWPEAFGRAARGAREQAGLTQRALSERTGVRQSWISQLEGGRGQPSLTTIVAIAQACEITASELMAMTEERMGEGGARSAGKTAE